MSRTYTLPEVKNLLAILHRIMTAYLLGAVNYFPWDITRGNIDSPDNTYKNYTIGGKDFFSNLMGKMLTFMESITPAGQQLESQKDIVRTMFNEACSKFAENVQERFEQSVLDAEKPKDPKYDGPLGYHPWNFITQALEQTVPVPSPETAPMHGPDKTASVSRRVH